ncbi:DUF1254 domain-containing protein [Methylorubrum rhodesianum]|uniref:DUF1254 domain-containing protein n=1 Tax=Methylorubrum TaxID=2282523 RepID=UPI0016210AF9|nr:MULTISPECIES: DUF1254 domain-containing protein [Methylorubrum]MBB5764422.1 hypothetical protein [Methylorubrum rhodesianum]MBI1689615.1 DUF1254 domain-containing protein [Methylorubrum sp. DB1722]
MIRFLLTSIALFISASAFAQSSNSTPTSVTVENFTRAESDLYFATAVREAGSIGRFDHHREVMAIDKQTVIRANRDTLYSAAVFDLDAGPVTITLPEAGNRFMSLIFINEDQYALAVEYGAGKHTMSKDMAGTRYVIAAVRTFIDPTDPNDIGKVHALQNAIKIEQAAGGSFNVPNWDLVSQKKVRDALLVLAGTLPDTKRMFGKKDQVDPVRHLIGTASGWGGNPEKDATYVTVTPSKNDGKTVYRLRVKDVPVDGFWSISMYNAAGYFEPNSYNAYSLNNLTVKKDADGSSTIQLGGCDGKIPNCLPTTAGWNYWVRLYRPRQTVIDGQWTFPEPEEVP